MKIMSTEVKILCSKWCIDYILSKDGVKLTNIVGPTMWDEKG